MSNQGKQMAVQAIDIIKKQEAKFMELDAANGSLVDFAQECLFARQQLLKNEFTLKTAANNPNSLQAAVLNVAAIGISLNPASAHAYLVPRDGAICLDISYRGLSKIATDAGAIKWAKVELVYEHDKFSWRGPALAPDHEADPFSDRGAIKGGYCIAKLPDGEILTEVMPVEEINKIRDTSKAYQKGGGPWKQWYEEMAKKTILKRAYKSWPQTPNRRRVDLAVEALHQSEGTAYTIEQHTEFMELLRKGDALKFYMMRLSLPDHVWIALYNSFDKGHKVEGKKQAAELENQGIAQFNDIKDAIHDAVASDDRGAVEEVLGELDADERAFVLKHLSADAAEYIQAMEQAA